MKSICRTQEFPWVLFLGGIECLTLLYKAKPHWDNLKLGGIREMPRPPRNPVENGLYFVTVHASGREKLFRDKEDLERFFTILKARKQKYNYRIYGFVLMPNHYHLILQTSAEANISKVMQALNTSYSLYFNHHHHRAGHLMARRYESRLLQRDKRLLELTRYIHLDPVKKGLVNLPQDYAGSSYREYLGMDKRDLVDCNSVLSFLKKGDENVSRVTRYQKFVEKKERVAVKTKPDSQVDEGVKLIKAKPSSKPCAIPQASGRES